ncbi:hypothetical protein ACJD0Z_11775 [Flavobacteriaceae bacterium M23B6Z8]
MKSHLTLLLLLLCFPLFSQISCDDFDLLLEEKVPSSNCYEQLVFTIKTPNLLNGSMSLNNLDDLCYPTNLDDVTKYRYKLQIISASNGDVVSEKHIAPEDYNFYRNNHYFYILYYNDYKNSHGQFYGKLIVEKIYFLPVGHFDYWKCPNGPYKREIICETSRVSGCPPPQPNLRLKALTVNNNGQNYNLTSGQVPNIYFGENATFEVTIENNGNATANSSPFALYASAFRNAFDQNYDAYQFASGDGGSIPAGSTKKVTVYNTFYEYVGSLSLVNDNIYRIYSFMDHVNRVPESDETLLDNVREFPWRYIKTGGSTDPGGEDPCVLCPIDDMGRSANSISTPYSLFIYDFTGTLISSVDVINETEAQQAVKKLPKGLYIIKTPFGDRKIAVE